MILQLNGYAERILVIATQRETPLNYLGRVRAIEQELDALLLEYDRLSPSTHAAGDRVPIAPPKLSVANTLLTHVVRNRQGLFVAYNGTPTYAPAFAKLFTADDALWEAAQHPNDEGWQAVTAPHT